MSARTFFASRPIRRAAWSVGLSLAWLSLAAAAAYADQVLCKNGMQHEGQVGKIAGTAVAPPAPGQVGPGGVANLIVLLDDELRRVFISTYQVQRHIPGTVNQVAFTIPQRVAQSNQRIGSAGPIFDIQPFDEFGRRALKMNTARGAIDIVQGITKITPTYCKVESLLLGNAAVVWDMRIATTSIPRTTLAKIFDKYLDPQNAQHRLQVVKFYVQSDRFDDAREELERAIKDFPELADLKRELVEHRQLSARRALKELELRRKAGQHAFAYRMLTNFPNEDVAGTILLEVSDQIKAYDADRAKIATVLNEFDELAAQVTDASKRGVLAAVRKELEAELNLSTLDRMADFLRLADDTTLTPEHKLSLCVSGWLMGNGAGIDNLAVSLSLVEVRNLIKEYLSEPSRASRKEILSKLLNLEGGQSPTYVAKIVAHMKPPVETPPGESPIPGFYKLSTPGMVKEADVTYFVQLPPEYDPYRKYPTIVTLSGAGSTPEAQIDWWAGAYHEEQKIRVGQASRRGYIVIAPQWRLPNQTQYEYSPREAAAVLFSLRDACRRFSVDTDRVYLSGHSMGGDAVWDLALAHPDLFAGTIPIVAQSDKYVARYWENARHAPLYFVGGELDGDKLVRNSRDFDRYLRGTNFDCTVVEYQGRGHEHFIDEIQHLFTWMELHQRNFFPREFNVGTMRSWDNFFWWVEVDELPPRSMVNPANWPPPGGTQIAKVEGQINENNSLRVITAAKKATLWLAPEMVDLTKIVTVNLNGKSKRVQPAPTVETLLEDVRTRGDRQHPFWMTVEL